MAKNWNVTEALKVVMDGKDLKAIRDIGRRFPLFLFFVLHDPLEVIRAFGERVTVRTVNKHLEGNLDDATEIIVHAEVRSKELELGGKEKVKVEKVKIEKMKKEAKLVDAGEGKKEREKKEKIETALKDVEEDKIEIFDIREEEEEIKVSEKVKDKKIRDEEVEEKEEIEEDDLDFDVEDLLEE